MPPPVRRRQDKKQRPQSGGARRQALNLNVPGGHAESFKPVRQRGRLQIREDRLQESPPCNPVRDSGDHQRGQRSADCKGRATDGIFNQNQNPQNSGDGDVGKPQKSAESDEESGEEESDSPFPRKRRFAWRDARQSDENEDCRGLLRHQVRGEDDEFIPQASQNKRGASRCFAVNAAGDEVKRRRKRQRKRGVKKVQRRGCSSPDPRRRFCTARGFRRRARR